MNGRFRVTCAAILMFVVAFLMPTVTHADANDFSFDSFEADYYISRTPENRSTMRVQEEFIARFPSFDQNHGIERAIPTVYDDHPVDLRILSVQDATGNARAYSSYKSGDYAVLRIGDANTFVHGTQTYRISYTLQDVTKGFADHDELYWDTNGTEWAQTFGSATSRFHFDSSISSNLTGQSVCYSGRQGNAGTGCVLSTTKNSNETILSVSSTQPLTAGQNISVVVGFQPGTFSAYTAPPLPLQMKIFLFGIVPVLYVALPIWFLAWGIKKWRQSGRDRAKIHSIVPEYLPPKDHSVIRCDVLIHTKMTPMAISATIIDLAVRHYLRIYEVGSKEYEIELTKEPTGLKPEEVQTLGILFGDTQDVGNRVSMKDKKSAYLEVAKIGKEAYLQAIESGLMVDTRRIQKRMYWTGGGMVFLSLATLSPILLLASIITLIAGAYMPARTEEGVSLKAYLDGTKMYMEVAEAERLKALQAPDTAEKVDVTDKGQLVKLYERLLPIAMLYGIEKKWISQFEYLYTEQTSPDWYVGSSVFRAAAFGAVISNFSTTAVTSFSPPTNSSGSGLSGGGGFSGGGGGGGGGGGW